MSLFSRRSRGPALPRHAALTAHPVRVQPTALQELPGGGAKITIQFTRSAWARRLGALEKAERTFELDYLGREVYDACDGKSDVQTIIKNFAAAHKISVAEAEISVTTFLRTLMVKGLIVMAVRKELTPNGK